MKHFSSGDFNIQLMAEKLEYEGSVYLYNTGYPEELVQKSKNKLAEYGVLMSDSNTESGRLRRYFPIAGSPTGPVLDAHQFGISRIRRRIGGH